MRINGLERNEVAVGAVSQDSGVVIPSRPREQLRVQAFRRALLIVENNSQLSDAFDAAHNLVDQATGEIVILKAASENRQTLSVAERPDWLTRTNKIDILEIRRRSLDAASIDELTQEYGCDLVVLTMESQDNERRLLKGCATEAIFRRLTCPSLIFGPKAGHLSTARRNGPMIFATSFQRSNLAAVGLAARVANLCDCVLECIHVLPDDMTDTAHGCSIVPQIMRNALITDARRNDVILRPEQCHIVYSPSVSDAVFRVALDRNARFITLGIQQSGAVASHLPMRITSSIIAFAPCPVLTLASM